MRPRHHASSVPARSSEPVYRFCSHSPVCQQFCVDHATWSQLPQHAQDAGALPEPLTAAALCGCLLDIWRLHAGSSRMTLPLLKTADTLFARGAFTASTLQEQHFCGLLDAVKQEGRKSGDLARLVVVASLLCHIVRCGGIYARDAAQVRLGVYVGVNRHAAPQSACGIRTACASGMA